MKNLYIILLLTFAFGQDYSLSFDGENERVEAGIIDLTGSPFTIESWIKIPPVTFSQQTNIIDSGVVGEYIHTQKLMLIK